jgi:cytoskeletal protein RodZ
MPTVAEQLRAAREAQHLTIHHVADITKIRTDHLRALEEGDFDVFTAPVYIKGFTRCYATLLKLDVSEVMRQLDAELSQTQKFSEPPNLTPHRRTPLDFVMLQLSKVNWRTGLVVVAILAVLGVATGAVAIWRHYQSRDPLKDLPPGVYQPPASAPAETLPLPPAPKS